MFSEASFALRSRFSSDGFVVLDSIIDASTCALLNQRLESVLRKESSCSPDKLPKFDTSSKQVLGGPSKRVLQVVNIWKADVAFRSVVCSPSLGRMVATLGGWRGARVMNDQVCQRNGVRALTLLGLGETSGRLKFGFS
jgi:hypothetical protein